MQTNGRPRPKGRASREQLEARAAQDALTVERIRAIDADPDIPEEVKQRLFELAWEFNNAAAIESSSDELFAACVRGLKARTDWNADAERAAIVAYAEQHEPEEYRVARRCVEIWEAELERDGDASGANYFMEQVDKVTEGGSDGLVPNPDSSFFVAVFAKAVQERGRGFKRYVALKKLIAEVERGASLAEKAEEAERRWQEAYEQSRTPDERIVRRVVEMVKEGQGSAPDVLFNLANDLGIGITHRELIHLTASIAIREARKTLAANFHPRLRSGCLTPADARNYLRKLERLTTEKGGVR